MIYDGQAMKVNMRALIGKLNDTTRAALESAAGLCMARTNYSIEIEHLLLKFVDQHDNDFAKIARHFALDLAGHAASLQRSLEKLKSGNARTPTFSPMLMEMLIRA